MNDMSSVLTNLKLDSYKDNEKEVIAQILREISDGKTDTLNELLAEDYEEIPVDIDTFLRDRKYLGNFTDEGRELTYREWPEAFREWFPNPLTPSPYIEVALTGAIGLGKSSNADYALVYQLYRLMCLKNPNKYYGQPASTIWFCFYNNTLNSATSAAYEKFQAMIQSSPWFMQRGKIYGTKNKEYLPDKNIKFKIGSTLQHTLGLNIMFCLEGNSEVLTENGWKKIKDLEGIYVRFVSIDKEGNQVLSDEAKVIETKKTTELIEIEMEDGSIVRCTPEHKFMLKDGSYKEAQFLTEKDELMEISRYSII